MPNSDDRGCINRFDMSCNFEFYIEKQQKSFYFSAIDTFYTFAKEYTMFLGNIIGDERSTFIPTTKYKEQCLQHYSHLVIYLHNYIST